MKRRYAIIAAVSLLIAAVFILPFVITRATDNYRELPRPELPAGVKECVKPGSEMRLRHMKLLYQWRDEVVREGKRAPIVIAGVQYKKSLTGSCIRCHGSKEKFCDRCHMPLSVAPACWDCHIYPKETRR